MDFSHYPILCILLFMFPLIFSSTGSAPPLPALRSSPEKAGASGPVLQSPNRNFTLEWIPSSSDEFKLAVVFLSGTVGSPQVWTANRNRPVGRGATLELQSSGNLVLVDGGSSAELIWSTNTTDGRDLELLDSGNLVLMSAAGELVWQSFDHPTDVLLPGQTIRTGQRVIASQSLLDSREGMYAVEIVTGGLIMFVDSGNTSWPYHVVGFSQNDEKNTVFSVMNTSCKGTRLTISQGGGEAIFQQEDQGPRCNRTFRVPVGSNDNDRKLLKFFRLDSDGNFRTYLYRVHYGWGIDQEVFSGSTACSLPNRCGSFGICSALGECACPERFFQPNPPGLPAGCQRVKDPVCGSRDNQLLELMGVNYFVDSFVNQSVSTLADCKKACLDSCNCTAAFYDQALGQCYSYESVMSLRLVGESSLTAFIKVGSKTVGDVSLIRGSLSKQLLAGIIVGVVLAIVGLISLVVVFAKIRKRMLEMNDDEAFLETLPGLPYRFSYKELNKATDGFKHRLGVGGFGSVYEGRLLDGSKVAVKRLESARQGHKEFHAEVAALGSISHLNLVRLRGFCVRGCDRLLVYEYLPNQSLEKWLFEKVGDTEYDIEKVLDWPTRFKIAVDTARGLAFLHEESRERIIHLDVKPQNILLDDDFTAKLSDFGLSKLIDRQQNDVITNMKGTPGYLAPEWLLGAAVTSKSDVYSYGMVLLELVSGRRNLDLARNTLWYFPAWAVLKVELHGSIEEVVDPRLGINLTSDSVTWSSLVRMLKVAFWCIQEDPNMRPSMTNVLHMLEGLADVDEPPSLLQFAVRTMNNKTVIDSFQQQSDSSVDLSNWVLSAPR